MALISKQREFMQRAVALRNEMTALYGRVYNLNKEFTQKYKAGQALDLSLAAHETDLMNEFGVRYTEEIAPFFGQGLTNFVNYYVGNAVTPRS